MIKTSHESSQRQNFQQNLTLDNIEEGKKHCQFPEEMMKSVWIFNRIKLSQIKKSAKNTPSIKNDDDGKTQTSPDATGNASNFETFENPMSP